MGLLVTEFNLFFLNFRLGAMTYRFFWERLSLFIIILRASAGDSGNIDYQANSGGINIDSQANSGDVTGWIMGQGALDNSEGPAQAQFNDGQTSDWLASDNEACPRPDTYDIQSSSSNPQFDKKGVACKNDSPPTTQQRKKKPVPAGDFIIIPDPMPAWPKMQLQPNRQMCDHETYSVPACAVKEGARFISLFLYDIPVCIPCTLFSRSSRSHRFAHLQSGDWSSYCGSPKAWGQLLPTDLFCADFEGHCHDPELLWCCQLLVPTVSLFPQVPR